MNSYAVVETVDGIKFVEIKEGQSFPSTPILFGFDAPGEQVAELVLGDVLPLEVSEHKTNYILEDANEQ